MNGVVIGGPGSGNAGGTTLSEQHKNAKKLLFKVKDSLERLERLESSTSTGAASSPELAYQINNDISHLHSLCIDMDRLWRSVAVKSQRDHWKRQVEQIAEDAESLKESLEKYFARNQRRTQEINERAELFGRANGESSHVLRIFDDETQALQSARNSSRMLEDAYSSGVAILSKFSEQRESMKSAHRKLLDVLNTVGLSNSVLRLIERRNRVDTWIKYAGMILTFIVLIVMWRWKH